MSPATHLGQLQVEGFALLRSVVSASTLASLIQEAERLSHENPHNAHGIRSLLERSAMIASWAGSAEILALLPKGVQPVRGILFDKTEDANWKVPWHQDLTITVAEQVLTPDYGPWSVKEDTMHVQPPISVLEGMVTLRLHLDDTPEWNGALRVLPASHQLGRLGAEQIQDLKTRIQERVCSAAAADVLLMKPLILHASSASTRPGHRRVVHVEYARKDLLHPLLSWNG